MRLTGFIVILLSLSTNLFGQVDELTSQFAVSDTHIVSSKLFESDNLFEITLKFDITTFRRNKSDTEQLPAVLIYHISETDSVVKNLKLKARGNVRRSICDYPPIRLNFRIADSTSDEFSDIDKLKLVTHCRIGYEEYVLEEYIIYKLFNLLTDNSFKVRLLRIKYIDTSRDRKPHIQFGFAIEPVSLLEKRLKNFEVKTEKFSQKLVIPEVMDRMAIFQYMIGNTDWELPSMHNVIIMTSPGTSYPGLGLVIPYDYDYSGLVNASYAIPSQELPIKSVTERYYMGICRDAEVFKRALEEFSGKKEEFYTLIKEFPYLREREKKRITRYLDGFFNDFGRNYSIVNKLLSTCKEF